MLLSRICETVPSLEHQDVDNYSETLAGCILPGLSHLCQCDADRAPPPDLPRAGEGPPASLVHGLA